ncbi:uncharacterized protein Z520_04164 [Fonsecaea multimorphosa CBS 102226]|uniref:NAD-dependent epimerase/dehydratase domain-containing protein n=1 Tax=Fonsecaea multimorphosa CBS 102226 TaxID=1442371 RepID=A0A0D2KUT2_9EURO|nr:uncharacterized protein Z520_04164 [Fonsecaea multimorphosa CBS 102226]KIY00479.1 hypothetical protein Z520_04164 [Fonsecaea multimorphosa CBS 102226]OAL26993.1 hypothetical protein AYO22_03937 [Fonsecaea multimorphosa]
MTQEHQHRRIPKSEQILVTGANGYIASHIIDLLLEEGYNVRGTVRGEKPWLNKFFEERYGPGRFETAIVTAMNVDGAFDKAIRGVAGVVHVATDVSFSVDPDAVIPGVVAGTVNLLKTAAAQQSVKSFVLTSSSTAALIPEVNKRMIVDENTWNDAVVEAVYNKDAPEEAKPYLIYAASKTLQEREFWKWAKENNPGFAVNSVLPNMNLGQLLLPEGFGSTMGWTRAILEGNGRVLNVLPPQWYVDVRDDARVHVAALLDPKVENERLFAFAGPYNWTDVINILTNLRPDNDKIPKAPPNEGRDLTDIKGSKRAEELIKSFFGVPGWTSLEDSLAAGIADLK